MAAFKKSSTLSGKFKLLAVNEGIFIDTETGEQIDVASILEEVYGSGQPFDLSTTQKSEDEISMGGE